MTHRMLCIAAAVVSGCAVAGGCATGNTAVLADSNANVAQWREQAYAEGEVADYGIDAFGRVETGLTLRSRMLPLEPPRPTPYQEFRYLMDGRERWAFYGYHWDPSAPDAMQQYRTLVDRRERFLRAHGTRVKYALGVAGLKAGLDQDEAEQIVSDTLGRPATWRDSADDSTPGLTADGQLDYSHDVIERVAWNTWNGFGRTRTFLHFRNGTLERWEVHAEE